MIDRLKKQIDPEVISEREKAVRERVRAQTERAQQRLGELVGLHEHQLEIDPLIGAIDR